MIEEEHIRFVAAADVTDDCQVAISLRKKRLDLTPSQARHLAAELTRAADEAEAAAAELLPVITPARFDVDVFGPDCRDGKHPACDGRAWDDASDEVAACACRCHEKAAA